MARTTRFSSLAAVDAWDAHYRWRDGGTLHDGSIDATWWRVADALAVQEDALAPLWAHRFVNAFSRWQLLPDARLLASAGTDRACCPLSAPVAVVNVAAFVGGHAIDRTRLDGCGLIETAALATRLLDDAVLQYGADGDRDLHVGIIGLADALRMFGLPYGSDRALRLATTVASLLAEGCLRGNVDLAAERGCRDVPAMRGALLAGLRARGMPSHLVQEAAIHGLRHLRVTAIEPHPELARLANEAADALDPSPQDAANGCDEEGRNLFAAQARLAAAMQPCIDADIRLPGPAPCRLAAASPHARCGAPAGSR